MPSTRRARNRSDGLAAAGAVRAARSSARDRARCVQVVIQRGEDGAGTGIASQRADGTAPQLLSELCGSRARSLQARLVVIERPPIVHVE